MNKILAIAGFTILIILIIFLPHKMIGPGKLGKSHEEMNKKCLSCHQPFAGVSSEKCIQCHQLDKIGLDSNGQVMNDKILFHKNLKSLDCMSCHIDHNGSAAKLTMKTFDHSLLSANGKPDCAGCHATPGNQLHQHLTPNTCANCHNTDRWETESFDHKLLPADLINDCSSCHKAPADDLHQQLSGSCQTCHTYTAWKPSTFQHEKYFVFDKHHTSTCKNCHLTRDLKEYTCTNCHEHNLSELIPEHREEGIQTNIEKCAKCHKSSNEDDIRYNQENNSIKEQDVNKIKKYVNENDKENSGKDDD